jgi:hypothetical protein
LAASVKQERKQWDDAEGDAPLGFDPSIAAIVGDWYLRSRSAHRNAEVIEAYRQLERETDHLYTLITRGVRHSAVRIAFTRCVKPYESDKELISAVGSEGTLEITSAASVGRRLHPLLGCEFGGAFDRFRAVHDLIGHAKGGYGFDLGGECAAWRIQNRLHSALARSALATELYGVNAARSVVGEAPELRALLPPPSIFNAWKPPWENGSSLEGPVEHSAAS